MQGLFHDIRYGLRTLAKNRAVTIIAVLTLAFGIGANSAVFTIINAVLLNPLRYKEPERLVWVWASAPGLTKARVSPSDFLDWNEQNQSFERITCFRVQNFNLANGGNPERIQGGIVSADFFTVLGVQPLLGRTFHAQEDQLGQDDVVVVSYGFWQRRLGSDPNLVGKTLNLNGRPFTIIGVTPKAFYQLPAKAEIWTPLVFSPTEAKNRGAHYLSVIARLKPDVTIQQAQNEMEIISRQLQQQYPDTNAGRGAKVVALNEEVVGDVRTTLLILFGAVTLVLLLAAANVANLLLSWATVREREIAVRSALGATRMRLFRQLLTESLLLSLLGGILGILLAYGAIHLLLVWGPNSIPRADEIGIDSQVLGFALLISLLTGIIFGVAPAVHASRPNLNESLKEGGRGGTQGLQHRRIHNLLAVSEIALALVLLIGAGLLIKSFYRIQRIDPGLNPLNVLTMEIALPRTKYVSSQQQASFFQQLLEHVKSLPGVQYASVINDLPLASGGSSTAFVVGGHPAPVLGQEPRAHYRPVSSDYFLAMGIPLIKGRSVTERDTKDAPLIVVISQGIAQRFFPNEDPIGKRIGIDSPPEWREIVGIAGDVRHHGLDNEVKPHLYIPYLQNTSEYLTLTSATMSLVIRTTAPPQSLAESVRREVLALDKDQPVSKVKTMEQVVDESITQRHFNMMLLIILAIIALILAAVGVYSVISYSVTRRTQEIGVRMALGAKARDILWLVLRQSIMLILIGSLIGLSAAFMLTRVMSSLLFGVSPTDPLTFGSITLFLILVALSACLIPANRATRVDPMVALRCD